MFFAFEPSSKQVKGTGTYQIDLSGSLTPETGDLNLCRLASNFLDGVPTYSGASTTGDMSSCRVSGAGPRTFTFTWDLLRQPSHFPGDTTTNLTVSLVGAVNDVRTACPIQIAAKPTVELNLISRTGAPMIFGGIYTTALRQCWSCDNIGVTPLVYWANASATNFSFDVTYEASALPQDGNSVEAALEVHYSPIGSPPPVLDVFYTETLSGGVPFDRIVGSLPSVSPGLYLGTVNVPSYEGTVPATGFFRAQTPCP
jgi:hypothetical protein